MAFIQDRGRKASRALALKRGSFPNFDGALEGPLGCHEKCHGDDDCTHRDHLNYRRSLFRD